MGAVETKVFHKVPPWEAASAAQNTQLEKEVVQLLWRKWRNDSRSEDGKVDFNEFLTLANTIKKQWERWGDSDSESEDDDAVGKEEHNDSFSGQELSKDEQSEQSDAKAEIGGGQDGSGDAQCGVQNTSGGSKHEDDDSEENNEDPEMRQLFNLLDRDEDDFLEFSDLLAFIFSLSPELSAEEKRLRSFRFYDRAGNGAIFKEEMLHTLRVLGDIPDSGKVKTRMPDEIENLFSLMDFAHNGKISEQEFLSATGHYRRLGQLLTIDRWENFRTDMVVALQRDLDLWRERKKKNVGAKLRWERRRDEKEKEANEKGAGN